MTEIEKQWKREESAKFVGLLIIGLFVSTLCWAIIFHSFYLLAVRCSF